MAKRPLIVYSLDHMLAEQEAREEMLEYFPSLPPGSGCVLMGTLLPVPVIGSYMWN